MKIRDVGKGIKNCPKMCDVIYGRPLWRKIKVFKMRRSQFSLERSVVNKQMNLLVVEEDGMGWLTCFGDKRSLIMFHLLSKIVFWNILFCFSTRWQSYKTNLVLENTKLDSNYLTLDYLKLNHINIIIYFNL